MSARPKPWEMANALPPPSTFSFSYGPGAALGVSPTFQTNSSYFTSSSTSYDYSQFSTDPSPQQQGQTGMQSRNWATSGPTISPDLNTLGTHGADTEAIYSSASGDVFLDAQTPGQSRRTSSNQLSSYQTSPTGNSVPVPVPESFDQMDPSMNNIDNIDETTFNDYLDFDFGQTQTQIQSKQMDIGANFNDEGNGNGNGNAVSSPGIFGTSSSTPAPSSRSRTTASSSSSNLQDHGPTSSRSF